MGNMRRTFTEILELALHAALTPEMCDAIMRKSGFRAGGKLEIEPEEIPPWFPKGGYPGDHLYAQVPGVRRFSSDITYRTAWVYATPMWLVAKMRWKAIRRDPDFYVGKETLLGTHTEPNLVLSSFGTVRTVLEEGGKQSIMDTHGPGEITGSSFETPAFGGIGRDRPNNGDVPTHFYRLFVRNSRHGGPAPYPTNMPTKTGSFGSYVMQTQPQEHFEQIWEGERRRELMRWDNIPVGDWHFPYNVNWFVTKRDLAARYHQNRSREMKLRTGWVKGNPPATLHLRYSTDNGQSWQDLMSVDLQPGGICNTGWLPFPEGSGANGDVLLGSFLSVRAPIARLDMGQIDAFMRWEPVDFRDLIAFDEFGNSLHQPRGSQTLTFDLAAPGRLTPGPGGNFFYADYKFAPEAELYYPFSLSSGFDSKADAIDSWYWNRGPGGQAFGGAPGWTQAWIQPRWRKDGNAKVTVQMVQTLPAPGYEIVPEGDGVRVRLGYESLRLPPSTEHMYGRIAHVVGHAYFGAQHGGDGIMRPDADRGLTSNNYGNAGIGLPSQNDVYSVYRWLWG